MNGQFCRSCGTPRMPGGGAGCSCGAWASQAAPARPLFPTPPAPVAQPPAGTGATDGTTFAAPYEPAPAYAYAPHPAYAAYGQAPTWYEYGAAANAQPYGQAPGQADAYTTDPYAAEAAGTRTAELAAAEDFDPLRIRPYVTLDENAQPVAEPATAGPLPPLATTPPPHPGAMPPHAPTHRAGRRPAHRPAKALALGVTAAAVLSTAAFASGMFSGGTPHDEALADTTHTGLPDGHLPDGATTGPAQPSARSSLAAPSPTDRATTDAGGSGTSSGTGSAPAGHRVVDAAAHPATSRGDNAAQVAALQRKLSAMHLYHGPVDGSYNQELSAAVHIYQMYRHVDGDEPGVYGPHTRSALDAEQDQSSARQHDAGGHNGSAGHSGYAQQASAAARQLHSGQDDYATGDHHSTTSGHGRDAGNSYRASYQESFGAAHH